MKSKPRSSKLHSRLSVAEQKVEHVLAVLDGAEIDPVDDKVKLHLPANRDQLEALLNIVGAQLGVNIPPPPAAPGAPR